MVSASAPFGLGDLLARVRELLPLRPFEFDPDDVGTQPLRFFVVEYLREAAFDLLEEEVPYAFTAEVEEFRENARPVYIRVTLFVERETQKAIIIGHRGGTIKALGTHARTRLEEPARRCGVSRLLGQGPSELAEERRGPDPLRFPGGG